LLSFSPQNQKSAHDRIFKTYQKKTTTEREREIKFIQRRKKESSHVSCVSLLFTKSNKTIIILHENIIWFRYENKRKKPLSRVDRKRAHVMADWWGGGREQTEKKCTALNT